MADGRFDAVVLGGGHHATIIAPLPGARRAERRRLRARAAPRRRREHERGPGARLPDEPLLALDALLRASRLPRLRPRRRGPALRLPGGQRGDGLRGRLVVHRLLGAYRVVDEATGRTERWEEGIERTLEQIRRFSRRDADTYLRLLEAVRVALEGRLPRPPLQRAAAVGRARRAGGAARDPGQRHRARAPVHEPAPARVRLLRERRAADAVHARGDDVDRLLPRRRARACRASSTTCRSCSRSSRRRSRSAAARRSATRSSPPGASSAWSTSPRSEVAGITVEGDRATGIVLADGTHRRRRRRRQRARRSADRAAPARGPRRSTSACAGASANIHYDRGQLLWANLALHEPPAVPGGRDQPGRRPAAAPVLGPEGPRLHGDALPARGVPATASPSGRSSSRSVDTLWDTIARAGGQAPGRRRGVRRAAAPVHRRGVGRRSRRRFSEHLLDEWQRYAPNMTPDNVIAIVALRARRHRGQAPGHDRGRLLGGQHDRLAARPLPAGSRALGLSHAAGQPLQLLVEHALGLGHRTWVER